MRTPSVVRTTALVLVSLMIGPAQPGAQKLFDEGMRELADQIAAGAAHEQKRRVAISSFRELTGEPTILSLALAEDLTTKLAARRMGFEVVERHLLDKLLAEHRLNASGLIDGSTVKQLGRLAGVDAIVTGSVTDMMTSVAVNCRIIDVESGRVIAAAQTRVVKDDDLRAIMGRSADPLAPNPPSNANLVKNGNFAEHWSVGWNKHVGDPTRGNFTVQAAGNILHANLQGQNSGQVWQKIRLPGQRRLDGLVLEAGVKLIPKREGMLGLAPPVEAALAVQFEDANGTTLGQIMYTVFATTGLEKTGLAGVPQPSQATGQRCHIPLDAGFNRLSERLDLKARDCLSAIRAAQVAAVTIACWMRTGNDASSADAYLSDVKLYYK